ncbi:MAG: hypothetical protein JXA57_09865 [Armatimonadetes bacterium]|nr:hypothetical protein [Armatimonadota bacterium]
MSVDEGGEIVSVTDLAKGDNVKALGYVFQLFRWEVACPGSQASTERLRQGVIDGSAGTESGCMMAGQTVARAARNGGDRVTTC